MKFPRLTCCVAVVVSSWDVAAAFSVGPRRFASSAHYYSSTTTAAVTSTFWGRSMLPHPSSSRFSAAAARPQHRSTSSVINMLFGNNFFSNMAKELEAQSRINYESLDHPGPELAQLAAQQKVVATSPQDPHLAMATFAGGCFWGLELAYQRVPGVVYTAVGYTQGNEDYPTYNQVGMGLTGHTEAVMVYYDPSECSYEQLLDVFFGRVNPLTVNGQGNDRGRQYRTGIYYHSPEQEGMVRQRMQQEQTKYGGKKLATEVKGAMPFWPAEKYHHQYLEKGGRSGRPQDASKGANEEIRCYG